MLITDRLLVWLAIGQSTSEQPIVCRKSSLRER